MGADLKHVALAISSYRNDQPVLSLLETARTLDPGFGAIIVVDSQTTGVVENAIASRTWSCPVTCVSAATNIGSAGNLARRLGLAARTDLDWVYAINHDGELRPDAVAALATIGAHECSPSRPIGAVYPLRRLPNRAGAYDVTGRRRMPLVGARTRKRPASGLLDVYWSSSNGALYALAPVRRGLLPWADLWLGYEDLGYGLLLHEHGYRQVLSTDVVIDDRYEFTKRGGVWVTSKPSWYAYYHARNLLLVARRTRQPPRTKIAIAGRLLMELGVTAAMRDQKLQRLRFVLRGAFDGFRDRAGKFSVP